jgi:hypothetical protein
MQALVMIVPAAAVAAAVAWAVNLAAAAVNIPQL